MFGANVIRKIDTRTDSLEVHSIFPTLQGEGPYAGRPAIFLRLAGCSLACSWCDTEFEQGGHRVAVLDLVHAVETKVVHARERLCVITGGEPMRQNLVPLIAALTSRKWVVQIETAGIHWLPGLENLEPELLGREWGDPTITIVCSPKTPRLHPSIERYCNHFKYIVDHAEEADLLDGLPARAVSQRNQPQAGRLFRPRDEHKNIYVQPLDLPNDFEHTRANQAHCVALALKFGYRLSLQQHKLLNLP